MPKNTDSNTKAGETKKNGVYGREIKSAFNFCNDGMTKNSTIRLVRSLKK